jgi:4-diphosphocytidyl-2-C-methyl-D-erythritol kinase
VLGVRPDGYHLLRTVFQSLALHDDLVFDVREGPFALECADPLVPVDRRNLVWKAAGLVWAAAGRSGEPAGLGVRLTKRIPARGGLGGGSSDGAVALVAFDALWHAQLGAVRLSELAMTLGADVPFFLVGGTALGLDRGDRVEPLPDAPSRDVVLVFPPFGVSTPEAFRWFDEDSDARARPTPVPGGERRSFPGVGHGSSLEVVNELQGPVARRHPEIDEACRALLQAGAEVAAMTGSGSTVFGLFSPGRGEAGALALRAAGWRTLATTTASREATRPALEPAGGNRID